MTTNEPTQKCSELMNILNDWAEFKMRKKNRGRTLYNRRIRPTPESQKDHGEFYEYSHQVLSDSIAFAYDHRLSVTFGLWLWKKHRKRKRRKMKRLRRGS